MHPAAKRLFDKQEARARFAVSPAPDPTDTNKDFGSATRDPAPDPDDLNDDDYVDDYKQVDFQSSLSEAKLTAFGATSGAEAKMAPASASRHLTPSPTPQDSFSGGGVAQR